MTRFQDTVSSARTGIEKGQGGFTLVEMLVALSLFAMIAVIGVGLLRGSIDTQDAVQTRLQAMGGVNRLRAIMGHDLAQAAPRATRSVTGEVQPAFVGTGDGFAFVQAGWSNPDGAPRPDLQRVAYAVIEGEWRRARQPMLDGTVLNEGDRLIDDVSAVMVRYRDARGTWAGNWTSEPGDQLPTAVEVTLTRTARAPLMLRFLTAPSPPPPPLEPAA